MANPIMVVMSEASRQSVIAAWCRAHPILLKGEGRRQEASAEIDIIESVLHSLSQDILAEASEIAPTPEQTVDIVPWFLEYCVPSVARAFETFWDIFSKIETLTTNNCWWGDFLLHSLDFKGTLELKVAVGILSKVKAQTFQNAYCRHPTGDQTPRLFLEHVCMHWGAKLVTESKAVRGHEPWPEGDYNFPLKKMCKLNPEEFVPSIMGYMKKWHDSRDYEWEKAAFGLPSLFSHQAPDASQTYDKLPLLSLLKELMLEPGKGSGPILSSNHEHLPALLNLGLYITWSPNIHKFASVNDQKRIELFYFAKLDQNSIIYGLPIELFRKIFEENFFLGNRHKPCTQCPHPPRASSGMLVDGMKPCCWESCGCFLAGRGRSQHYEFCTGKEPSIELWGMECGMWKVVEEFWKLTPDEFDI